MDECLDHSYFGAGSIVTGGTISEGNSTISVVRPDSVCMELSVVIPTLVEELVDDHKVVAHKVQLIILPVSVPPTLLA